jgi:hypothetical protein
VPGLPGRYMAGAGWASRGVESISASCGTLVLVWELGADVPGDLVSLAVEVSAAGHSYLSVIDVAPWPCEVPSCAAVLRTTSFGEPHRCVESDR